MEYHWYILFNSNKLESLSGSVFKTENTILQHRNCRIFRQVADSHHRVQVGESIGNSTIQSCRRGTKKDAGFMKNRNGNLVNYKDFLMLLKTNILW